jgi:hypothetical protein
MPARASGALAKMAFSVTGYLQFTQDAGLDARLFSLEV